MLLEHLNVNLEGKRKITKKTDGGEPIINSHSGFQVRLPLALGVEIRGAAHTTATFRELTR